MRIATLAFACGLLSAACATEADPDRTGEPQPGDPDFERDPALDVDNVSAHGESRSHNVGENCMRCHQPFGPGRGQFAVAGTVFDANTVPVPDPIVELRTAPFGGGDLVLRIEGDRLGNFFTTEGVDLADTPLFPFVQSNDGALSNGMPFPVSGGACNHCHTGGFKVRALAPDTDA